MPVEAPSNGPAAHPLTSTDLAIGTTAVALALLAALAARLGVTVAQPCVGAAGTKPGRLQVQGMRHRATDAVARGDDGEALVPGEGIEPPTNGLQNRCSTAELTRQTEAF